MAYSKDDLSKALRYSLVNYEQVSAFMSVPKMVEESAIVLIRNGNCIGEEAEVIREALADLRKKGHLAFTE